MNYYIYTETSFEDDYDNWEEILETIVSQGKGKYFNKQKDMIISCHETIEINGEVFKPRDTLISYISLYRENGNTIPMEYDMEFELDEVVDILLDCFDDIYKDTGKTYADIIFEAKHPDTQIQNLLNELVDNHLKVMLGVIEMSMDEIRKMAANNEIKW